MAEVKLPSNSFSGKGAQASKQKQGPPKMEKIVTNEVMLKKPSRSDKLKASAAASFKNVMTNTVAPSIKDMILNAIWSGLSMIFFPDGSHKPMYTSTLSRFVYNQGYTAYGGYYSKPAQPQNSQIVNPMSQIFQNPIFGTMGEARDMVDKIQETINVYGFATWSTLYEYCGLDNSNWQGTGKYGWVSTAGNRIMPVNLGGGQRGYELIMPKAMPIDDLQIDPPPFD